MRPKNILIGPAHS